MKQLIDELKAIPGVVGACVYSSRNGLLQTNLPGIFKPERLTAVGKHLGKLCAAGRMSFDDLTDVSLHYDESVVVARELEQNLLLFAICDPSFNQNLLTMSFNLLQEEYRSGDYAIEQLAEAAVDKVLAPAVQLDDRQFTILEEMKAKLSRVLGPMAGFIFDEVVASWKQQGTARPDGISALLELLDKEIGDDEKSATYRQLIAGELRRFQEG